MKAFVKTLIGDVRNLLTVTAVLALSAAFALCGQPKAAWLVTPVLTITAVAYLARR